MTWAQHYATAAGLRWWPCEELIRWVGERQFRSILEAGAGNGANLWFLAEHADRVVGIDTYAEALESASVYMARRGIRNVELKVADVRSLPFPDASFDLVVDCMMSQHLKWAEHEPLYREYRRVLKPGGSLWLYHLDAKTMSARGEWKGDSDWAGLALFPDVDFFCLPIPAQSSDAVEASGFRRPTMRGLAREYPNGSVAHYTVLDAEAACA